MPGVNFEKALLRRALEEAVLEVLETMCFEFPIADPETGGSPEEAAVRASARFEGSLRGQLQVALTGEAPGRLAAAFLGLEEERVGGQEMLLMASELANMLCGASLSRLEPQGRLRIAPPEAGWGGAPCAGGCWLHFPLEQGGLAASLVLEEES